LAFVTLVVIAPLAEEVLFRGYLYGKLKQYIPIWLAVIVVSAIFGIFHLFGTDPIAWNLAVDTFALSVVLCVLRETTGNLWASVLLHMLKNGIAFYLLFINPAFLSTLVR
jgi:membrane protease YdiL (CAAX protease family)